MSGGLMAADLDLPSASPSSPVQLQAAAVYCAGFSCALAALGAQRRVAGGCDLGAGRRGCRWSRARELALREKVEELLLRRAEDARANEKVAGIFASHEQRWLAEKKALLRQVRGVVAAARAREAKREEEAEALRREAEEQRRAADEALAREAARREEAEERLRAGEELRERAEKDAAELRWHKVGLASAQRQLEADLARAAETAEAEVRAALEEEARLRRDAEHKDKILSAMLRKSKIDMEDREMLVREVKTCKARRKQAELEAERWRKACESSRGSRRGSSRSSARTAAADHPGCSDKLAANDTTKILFVDHVEGDRRKAPAAKEVNRYPSHVEDKPAVEEYQQGLQEWFQMETEKYATMVKHRHGAEIEAFTEQLRLKDEKLEAFRWRAVSTDIEATRLRCRIQDLEARLAQHNAGLEARLLDYGENGNGELKEDEDDYVGIPCSPAKIQDRTVVVSSHAAETKVEEPVLPDDFNVDRPFDAEATAACGVPVPDHEHVDVATSTEPEPYAVPARFRCEFEEEKEVNPDPGNAHSHGPQEASSSNSNLAPPPQKAAASACKTDIHALAVSYKIKRLKQQLAVLEKLAAEGKNEDDAAAATTRPRSRYHTMISFLSKHVKRYQSLDDKIDDLCARMEESTRSGDRERGVGEQSAALGQFLEETFQLQRLVVATGQKLLETQSRITPDLAARPPPEAGDDGVDMKRLMDVAGALLRDVQRGLQVRIARIIGELEGTLTFHGILHTPR